MEPAGDECLLEGSGRTGGAHAVLEPEHVALRRDRRACVVEASKWLGKNTPFGGGAVSLQSPTLVQDALDQLDDTQEAPS